MDGHESPPGSRLLACSTLHRVFKFLFSRNTSSSITLLRLKFSELRPSTRMSYRCRCPLLDTNSTIRHTFSQPESISSRCLRGTSFKGSCISGRNARLFAFAKLLKQKNPTFLNTCSGERSLLYEATVTRASWIFRSVSSRILKIDQVEVISRIHFWVLGSFG